MKLPKWLAILFVIILSIIELGTVLNILTFVATNDVGLMMVNDTSYTVGYLVGGLIIIIIIFLGIRYLYNNFIKKTKEPIF